MTRRALLTLLASLPVVLTSRATRAEGDSLDDQAAEYRRLREVRGHFQGGDWNADVDRWQGRKHVVMQELGERLGRPGTPEARVLELMGPADARAEAGSQAWALARPPEGTDHLLVYLWRDWHDFLYFACAGDKVLTSGWWMALE